VAYRIADFGNDASGLVAKNNRALSRRMNLMQLGMADARSKLFDDNLV
jgi:hypothetical protein